MCKALGQLGTSRRLKILSLLLMGERETQSEQRHRKSCRNTVQKLLRNKTGNVGMAVTY